MYEDYYRLYTCPFSQEPNPDFFFFSKEHKQVLSYLRFGVNKGEGNVVVTGDAGVGKTTLKGMLLSGLDSTEIITGRLVARKSIDQDIAVQICHEFGLPIRERTSTDNLIKVIQQFLQICKDINRDLLLVIDQAQELSSDDLEVLRVLSNYKQGIIPVMQVFFVGLPEFRQTIMRPEMTRFKDLVIASSHLQPLREEEVYYYISHRLNYAGWAGYELFTEDACHEIFLMSDGIPGKINGLCNKVLTYGCHQEIEAFNASVLHQALTESQREDTSA